MSTFLALLIKALAFLPDSFLLSALNQYREDLAPFINTLGYINFFIPFNILLTIFGGWASGMILTVIVFRIINKL